MNFKQIIDFIKKHKFTIIILLLVLWIIFENFYLIYFTVIMVILRKNIL